MLTRKVLCCCSNFSHCNFSAGVLLTQTPDNNRLLHWQFHLSHHMLDLEWSWWFHFRYQAQQFIFGYIKLKAHGLLHFPFFILCISCLSLAMYHRGNSDCNHDLSFVVISLPFHRCCSVSHSYRHDSSVTSWKELKLFILGTTQDLIQKLW